MASLTQLKSGQWLVRVRRVGVGSISKTFELQTEAKKWAESQEQKFKTVKDKITKREESGEFEEIARRYLDSYDFLEKAERTRTTEKQRIEKVVIPYFKGREISGISQSDLLDFRDKLAGTISEVTGNKYSKDQVRLILAAARSVFNFALYNLRLIQNSPALRLRIKAGVRRNIRIKDIEKKQFFQALKDDEKATAFFTVLSETGARPSEIANLKWSDINLPKSKITINRSKNGETLTKALTEKASNSLAAWFKHQAADSLKTIKIWEESLVFASKDQKTKKDRPYRWHSAIDKARKRNQFLVKITAHSFRHELISRLFEDTSSRLNILQIKEITGHKSLAALAGYAHLRQTEFREVLEEINKERRPADLP